MSINVYGCPKPDEIVKMYREGHSIENITRTVFVSRMFVKKSQAREHVRRVIYKYLMSQKEV